MAHPTKEKKKNYHLGMLNGKTPWIVSLCLLIVAGVVILGMLRGMGVADILALIAGLSTGLGALSWVYTRAGQGNASDPTKTNEQKEKDEPKGVEKENDV